MSLELINQTHFEKVIRQIFIGDEILRNSRKESRIVNPRTGNWFELDIWIPSYNLSFEFQDDYHYVTTWYSQIPLAYVKDLDINKRDEVNRKGVHLIPVPCWWDGTSSSLIDTIIFERPDLENIIISKNKNGKFREESDPISLNPPARYFNVSGVPDVGELMYASFVSNVTELDHNSWWLGEKYDGIRCCWNPLRKNFFSRFGSIINVNKQMLDMMSCFVDCEAWFGRGFFPETQKLLQLNSTPDCANLRLIAFDIPAVGIAVPYEARYKLLLSSYNDIMHPFLIPAARLASSGQLTTEYLLKTVIAHRGEGLIMRRPESYYVSGRSPFLVKLKTARQDEEALVVQAYDSKAYLLQLPDGTRFTASFEDSQNTDTQTEYKDREVKKGDVVTFSFDNFTATSPSLPVNPKILRKREDIAWSSISHEDISQDKGEKYSKSETKKELRLNCIQYATNLGLDPLSQKTWYSPPHGLLKQKTIAEAMNIYKGSYVTAMMDIFPDIGLQRNKFITQSNNWRDIKSRRKYFLSLSKFLKFDPLVASNWYSLSADKIMKFKSATSILSYYKGNFAKALIHLFPEVIFDITKFPKFPDKYSYSLNHQRQIMINFAKDNGLDPNNPDHWYSLSLSQINQSSQVVDLVHRYRNFKQMIIHLFPELGLVRHKFSEQKYGYWGEKENRKRFFDHFATQKRFDPLVANHWLPFIDELKQNYVAKSISKYSNGSITAVLQDVFPSVSFEIHSRDKKPNNYWDNEDHLKKFFCNFAQKKGFDPQNPTNWYSVSTNDLLDYKDGKSVLASFQGSLIKGLQKAFSELNFDTTKLLTIPKSYWANEDNRRKFFENFAAENNFNPFYPEAWYSINLNLLYSTPKSMSVLNYYNKSLKQALLHLFPDIGLDKSKIPKKLKK